MGRHLQSPGLQWGPSPSVSPRLSTPSDVEVVWSNSNMLGVAQAPGRLPSFLSPLEVLVSTLSLKGPPTFLLSLQVRGPPKPHWLRAVSTPKPAYPRPADAVGVLAASRLHPGHGPCSPPRDPSLHSRPSLLLPPEDPHCSLPSLTIPTAGSWPLSPATFLS